MACGGGGDCGSGGDNGDVLVPGARSGGDNGGWTPYPAFREHPLEREDTPFFSQMTARVCGG